MYPNAPPALAPQIDAFFATKADWDGGTLHGVTSAGGTFTTPVLNNPTINGVTINSGSITAEIATSTVNGTLLTTVLAGYVPMPPNGVPALGTDGKIPVGYIGDLTGATFDGTTLAAAISANGGAVTDATNLAVTVNNQKTTVGPAIASASTLAAAALPATSAGPLATQPGASGGAAITAALGFTPYSASNPAGYVTSANISATAPVQSVVDQKGTITASQVASALAGQDLSTAFVGGGKTGAQVQAAQVADEAAIAAAAKQATNAANTASAALPASSAGPLATISGSSASAAAVAALGYAPYNSSNPAGYVTSASVAATAPVQTVIGQKGDITASQIASGLAGANLSAATIGGDGATGAQMRTAQQNDETYAKNLSSSISSINQTATSASVTANSAFNTANTANQTASTALQASHFGSQNISVSPIGNSQSTLASETVTASAVSDSTREFMVNLGFSSSTGGDHIGVADKVTIYGGMDCNSGSSNCWASNFLAQSSPGNTATVFAGEFDVNNQAADAPPYSSRQVSALTANGTISDSTNYMTFGLGVGSVGEKPIFHYGVGIVNNSAKDAAFYDEGGSSTFSFISKGPHANSTFADTGGAPYGLNLAGSYSSAAITTSGATSTTYAMTMGANQKVCFYGVASCAYYKKSTEVWVFTNSGGTPVMQIDSTGNVTIKGSIIQNGQIAP